MQSSAMGSHLDPQLEDRILHEVKSHGVFDEFRKDSMADVDTKPAYQNLRQRVENTVKKFLSEQHWTPDMNKNQLREKLRRHITESGFLDVGVERIVDQVVNPKIGTVFQPRIEEITYKYLGLPPPPVKHEPPPPIMHPLPPLPLSGPPPLKIETSSLLPTGLEQVSPDSDKATVKSDSREDDKCMMDMEVDADEKSAEDDDESPPFEPLVKCVKQSSIIKTELVKNCEDEVDKKSATCDIKIEPMLGEKAPKVEPGDQQEIRIPEAQENSSIKIEPPKNPTSFETDTAISQDSQLSQVSSDSRISDVTANASHSFTDTSNTLNPPQTHSDQIEAVVELAPANISEEAQMPKFNENSCEMATARETVSDLHFDIKKDVIKFEGTERKSSLLEQEGDGNSVIVDEIPPSQAAKPNVTLENKDAPYHFGNLTIDTNVERNQTTDQTTPAATPTPTPHDSSFGSSLEDASYQQYADVIKNESVAAVESVLPEIVQEQSDKKEVNSSQNRRSSSSSSRHKKHSKNKRRLHDSKEKYGDKDRSKKKDRSRDKDKGDKDTNIQKSRHRDKERSRDKHRERSEKDRSKDNNKNKERSSKHDKQNKSKNDSLDRSCSSKRSSPSTARSHDTSSSKHEKNSTPSSSSSSRSYGHEARRGKHKSDRNHHRKSSKNGSSTKKDDSKSGTPKKEVLVDDHNSEKMKEQRRKSTDSNDEGKSGGGSAGDHNDGSQRVSESLNSSQGSYDKQQSQQKGTNNTSQGFTGKHTEGSDIINETSNTASTNEIITKMHRNKVVILNDMLENPNINFIDLGPTMTTYSVTSGTPTVDITPPKIADTPPKIAETTPRLGNTPPNIDITPPPSEKTSPGTNTYSIISPKNEKEHLLFFEETNAQFCDRLRLLNNAMDRCRRVVNNLRFDCTNELCDAFETLGEHRSKSEPDAKVTMQTCATLTIDCVPAYALNNCCGSSEKIGNSPVGNSVYESVYELHGKRRRINNGESKPSPTPSDASVNSKENMALDKNADMVKCVRRNASVNKLNQQQRYNSEDLYKPRPILSQRSRRRGMDALI